MKKLVLFWLFLVCLIFCGCGHRLGDSGEFYAENLIIKGVGPKISFEPTVEAGTLVLSRTFEDMSVHVFFGEGIWEKYLKNESDYLPGNEVTFKGTVEAIDGAAGNHYYNVKTIDKLELVGYPNAGDIKELFDGYNYCESDSDCEYFGGECPLGCYIMVNKDFLDISRKIVSNFVNRLGDERCVYDCLYFDKVVCNNYKCEMVNSEDENLNDSIICSPEEKIAENCNMIYNPVCGSDSRTYGNSCLACQFDTVESYTMGECESSAFAVEGDSEYLQEVEEILAKNGAVTCDLFYTAYDRQVHSFFMADYDRFYSAVDDYSDNLQRNVFYTLAVDGKIYNWSTFPDPQKSVVDSPADIESEIASLLMDLGKHPDFEINCYEGIDISNEKLFLSVDLN